MTEKQFVQCCRKVGLVEITGENPSGPNKVFCTTSSVLRGFTGDAADLFRRMHTGDVEDCITQDAKQVEFVVSFVH